MLPFKAWKELISALRDIANAIKNSGSDKEEEIDNNS